MSYHDYSIGIISRGYKPYVIDGKTIYLSNCKTEFEYGNNEMTIYKVCIDINGNNVRIMKKIIYDNDGRVKSITGWMILW